MDSYRIGDLVTWLYFNESNKSNVPTDSIRFHNAFALKHRTDLTPTSPGVKNLERQGEPDTSDVFEVVARI